jgi:pyridoxal 5'-phosphate synthase pdxS subunit
MIALADARAPGGGPATFAVGRTPGHADVVVGSGIFKSGDPAKRARACVEATTHFRDPAKLAEVSKNLGEAMVGRSAKSIPEDELFAGRGW